MTSDSNAFRRQPKVSKTGGAGGRGISGLRHGVEEGGRELGLEDGRHGAGHDHAAALVLGQEVT